MNPLNRRKEREVPWAFFENYKKASVNVLGSTEAREAVPIYKG